MRLMSLLFAWIVATLTAYVLGAIASQQVVLAQVGAYKDVPVGTNVRSTLDAVIAQPGATGYLVVIAIAFLVAFYVADIVKAVIPVLAGIAYPTAGAVGIVTALSVMKWQYDIVPILGAQSDYGFWLQIAAGVLGGVAFELLRPKDGERVITRA